MQRKPIILILTSRDEEGKSSALISSAIKRIGTHNVVVISDDKYGSAQKISRLDRLMTLGEEYERYLVDKRFHFGSSGKSQKKGRAYRIANAVKRYKPELILAITPYAYFAAYDSKRKVGFDTNVIYMMPYFVLDKQHYDGDSTYIVDNQDIKASLVSQGVPSRRIMTMGLPFDIAKKTPLEIATAKQELGLPRTLTIFLNATEKDNAEELFSLLLDQGNVINIVVYSEEPKTVSAMRQKADKAKANNVVILQKQEQFDEYLTACDAVVTRFERSTIYKCFKLGKPVITFGKGEQTTKELNFLVENGLVMRARENIEIVALVYRLIETGVAASYVLNGEKWVENSNIDNIASYLASYIGT